MHTESWVLTKYLSGYLGTWKEHSWEVSENKFGQNPETLCQTPVIYNPLDGTCVTLWWEIISEKWTDQELVEYNAPETILYQQSSV